MTRLEELILYILDRAKKEGKSDLSRFQVFKIIYLLQVFSIKYAGTSFLPDIIFIRQKNGPISVDIYSAMQRLESSGQIKKEIIENKKYGYSKHAFSLAKKLPKLHFDNGEAIFLDGFLLELLSLIQLNLKRKSYATEPMQEILKKEKNNKIKEGEVIDFASVSVDPDIVDVYSDDI